MKEAPPLLCLTYCNHQLAIWGINDTQINPGVLQLASLIEGRHGCNLVDVI